jgi:predicted Zn-dependent protease
MLATHAKSLSLLVVLMLVATVGTGCASDQKVIAQANTVNDQLKPSIVTDPELSNYIQGVGQRVIEAARSTGDADAPAAHKKGGDNSWMYSNDMKFHFVNSKTLNAFTTGGNHMYIYTALLQQCQSEDELAAVVAHEYAHVYARHVQQGMDRQYGILAGAAAAGAAGAAVGYSQDKTEGALKYGAAGAGVGLLAGQFLGMGFTRGDEDEADKYGFRFYARAGWDPNHFADFFKRMIAAGYDTTPELASDHPTLRSRVASTERRVSELPPNASQWRKPPIADTARFAQIKARSVEIGKTMPNDKSMQQAQELLAAFSSCVAPVDQPEQKAVKEKAAKEGVRKNGK